VLVSPEGGDHAGHRLGVRAFEDGDDLVLGLRLVEAGGQVLHPLAEGVGHRVPPLNLGRGLARAGGQKHQDAQGDGQPDASTSHGGDALPEGGRDRPLL